MSSHHVPSEGGLWFRPVLIIRRRTGVLCENLDNIAISPYSETDTGSLCENWATPARVLCYHRHLLWLTFHLTDVFFTEVSNAVIASTCTLYIPVMNWLPLSNSNLISYLCRRLMPHLCYTHLCRTYAHLMPILCHTYVIPICATLHVILICATLMPNAHP